MPSRGARWSYTPPTTTPPQKFSEPPKHPLKKFLEKIPILTVAQVSAIPPDMAALDAGMVGRHNARVNASFIRPADVLAYASGDLVANNTVAASVVPMALAVSRLPGIGGEIRRARLRKSGAVLTLASFRIHLYSALPVPTNGDNGVWLTDKANNAIGRIDVTIDEAYSDGAAGYGVPSVGTEINFTADTIYALLEARAAYVPASAEVFTVELELQQN